MLQGTSKIPGFPPHLQKPPQSSGGEEFWPLGSLVYQRLGSNTSVLSLVHLQLPSVFSNPIWYKANKMKDKRKPFLFWFDMIYKFYNFYIFTKLPREVWNLNETICIKHLFISFQATLSKYVIGISWIKKELVYLLDIWCQFEYNKWKRNFNFKKQNNIFLVLTALD